MRRSNSSKVGGDNITSYGRPRVAPRPYAVSVTPDGKTASIASLGDPKANGILTVIDLAGGKIAGTFRHRPRELEGMMMSADGRLDRGRRARRFDPAEGRTAV